VAIFVAALGLWLAWVWWADRSYRAAILAVELHMANGRFGMAARDLGPLLSPSADTGEAALLLARCEQERGRLKQAADALALVPAGSELAHKAILARMRLYHDQGQFAEAERTIDEAADDPRNDRAHVRVLLVPIFSQLGRVEEARGLLRDWWEELDRRGEGGTEAAIDQVRMHVELGLKPNLVEKVRAYLDQAHGLDPNDDRIWLGRANLAIRTGDFVEARKWLELCLKKRDSDAAVWTSWLRMGMGSERVELVRQAMEKLPADRCSEAELCEVDAWLAARRGDAGAERRAAERWVVVDPGDLRGIDRLIALVGKAGDTARESELRSKRAEVVGMLTRYEKLFDRNQPLRDAEEMAGLATKLGRSFEARAFLTIELAQDPGRSDLRDELERLKGEAAKGPRLGGTVAEYLERSENPR
jgi:tetratricopeptide (TPR) repeat protein